MRRFRCAEVAFVVRVRIRRSVRIARRVRGCCAASRTEVSRREGMRVRAVRHGRKVRGITTGVGTVRVSRPRCHTRLLHERRCASQLGIEAGVRAQTRTGYPHVAVIPCVQLIVKIAQVVRIFIIFLTDAFVIRRKTLSLAQFRLTIMPVDRAAYRALFPVHFKS